MKRKNQQLILLMLSFLVLGCVPQQRYVWSDYDKKLYSHYKEPAQTAEFHEALKETLDDAVSAGNVPPGIYAEYGFLLYEQGKIAEAILFYQKEADRWPESRFFMDKMKNVALKRNKEKGAGAIPQAIPDTALKQNEKLSAEIQK